MKRRTPKETRHKAALEEMRKYDFASYIDQKAPKTYIPFSSGFKRNFGTRGYAMMSPRKAAWATGDTF